MIEKGGLVGESRRALITAPPCLPVAPVMRRVWEDITDSRERGGRWVLGLGMSKLESDLCSGWKNHSLIIEIPYEAGDQSLQEISRQQSVEQGAKVVDK